MEKFLGQKVKELRACGEPPTTYIEIVHTKVSWYSAFMGHRCKRVVSAHQLAAVLTFR